jgi:hypothetical protein
MNSSSFSLVSQSVADQEASQQSDKDTHTRSHEQRCRQLSPLAQHEATGGATQVDGRAPSPSHTRSPALTFLGAAEQPG